MGSGGSALAMATRPSIPTSGIRDQGTEGICFLIPVFCFLFSDVFALVKRLIAVFATRFLPLGCGGWFGIKPIEQLVPVSFTRCRASTPGLSTWWSTTALSETLF